MSKVLFVIFSIVLSLFLHLLLFPFDVNGEEDMRDSHGSDTATTVEPSTSTDEVVFFKDLPDNVEVVSKEPETLFHFQRSENVTSMGVSEVRCDNAHVNLATDFDPHDMNEVGRHTECLDNELWIGNSSTNPILTIMKRPKSYISVHKCMTTEIRYLERIPTIGPHRPLWAKYGEYRYCPPQRWLHNVEHGSIIALYHPCADPEQIEQLKNVVKRCLFRHVITPHLNLTAERPLALVGWSASLEMPLFDFNMSKNFIKLYARTGPEKVFRDGQYGELLVEKAEYVTNVIDSEVCPDM